MRILYGIQGTGHGHISRAREILPQLSEQAAIDVLISGYNCKLSLEDVPFTQKRGISLAYDTNGGVSWLQTALKMKPVRFLRDVRGLDVNRYDLVLSDYEPITAWASLKSVVPSVSLSHQAAFLSEQTPRPSKQSLVAEQVLKHFAPCRQAIGFHFQRYDSFILPPIIRQDVRKLTPGAGHRQKHITVYLPAFDHQTLTSIFVQCPEIQWHLFSPFCDTPHKKVNVWVRPVGNHPFLESLSESTGVITGAGFETCAEAMYLGKKLLVVPIKNQYEQLCNAAAMKKMGIAVINKIDASFRRRIRHWLDHAEAVHLEETANTEKLIQQLMDIAGKKHQVGV